MVRCAYYVILNDKPYVCRVRRTCAPTEGSPAYYWGPFSSEAAARKKKRSLRDCGGELGDLGAPRASHAER